MRSIALKNKKGVSEIVSYVLLIIIAVTISVIVYNYLVKFIPKGNTPECPDGTSLILREFSCFVDESGMKIDKIDLANRGYWSINSTFIKAGKEGSKVRKTIGRIDFNPPLAPDKNITYTSDMFDASFINQIPSGSTEIELIPIIKDKDGKTDIICSKAIVTSPINCG